MSKTPSVTLAVRHVYIAFFVSADIHSLVMKD